MKLYFKPRVVLIGGALALGMIRCAVWQWDRHLQKQAYIEELKLRIAAPIEDFKPYVEQPVESLNKLGYRRFRIDGTYDFSHEVILRNRRFGQSPGVHAITPLRIAGSNTYILVSRGFLPLSRSDPGKRAQFQKNPETKFVGLIKESMPQKFLAPADPTAGSGAPWVDAWLRVNIPEMQKQLPYTVLPVYAEVMGTTDSDAAKAEIIVENSGRDEIFYLQGRNDIVQSPSTEPDLDYPIPAFDTVAPPDIHLGYVYEWSFMALITILACLILQLRPAQSANRAQ